MTPGHTVPVLVAVVSLLAICLLVLTAARIPVRADAAVAAVRAVVQLSFVALIIAWVFSHPQAVVLYLAVMLAIAAWTSTRRIDLGRRTYARLLLAIFAGAVAAVVPVFASGALDATAAVMLPFSAQIIGGSMTAASLAGSRLRDDAHSDWGTVEGWLAIGASAPAAVASVGRRAVARALIPALDQTRSAGLVVLPGAFVGLLLGGASPAEAVRTQVLVLIGLLAAESVAAVVAVRLLNPIVGAHRPREASGSRA